MTMALKTMKLKNGLDVVVVPMKGTTTVTVLTLFGVGSKYETRELSGISHFLEHMMFKGTEKRPKTLDISSELDAVGGVFNAFTSKEYTGYYAKVDATHAKLAVDIISDILLHSKLSQAEINRESNVIVEEMRMYRDTPMRYIHDVFEHLLYGDTPAGWDVIGTEETVLSFKRKHFVEYFTKHYQAANATVVIAGNISQSKALDLVRAHFKNVDEGERSEKLPVVEDQSSPRLLVHHKDSDQAHLMLGFRTVGIKHKDRFALEVLATLLGGNMSSRMFLSVRERMGLGYYVRTSSDHYTDAGFLVTAAGIDTSRVADGIAAILKEYTKVAKQKVQPDELKRAKQYMKGKMMIDLESSDEMAFWVGTQSEIDREVLSVETIQKKIDRVTVADVQRVAKEYFIPERLNLAMIGPFEDTTPFEQLLASY